MRRSLIPFAVLASCLALSGAATWSVRANEDAVVERRFEALILGARGRIVAALDGDLAMLRAAAVIVAASGRIDRRLFQSYVARAGLLRSSGRLESVGFLESDGRESRREVAGPCIERACQEALAIARDAGDLRLSAPLEAGRFAAIVPVYGATDGPREPVGFIYGVFRVAELVTSVLPSSVAVLRLQDGEQVLYQGSVPRDLPSRTSTRLLVLPGRTWTLHADAPAGFDRASRSRLEVLVGCVSLALSLMVFALAHLQARARLEAEESARRLRESLAERKEMQARLVMSDRLASLGALAAGVAHEINNPLAYTVANLEFLDGQMEAAAVPAELREAAAEAREGAERVRRIVKDLRVFSRPDDGQKGLVDVRVALDSAVNIALHDIKARAQLVKEYEDVPLVMASEVRLGQVFLNLLVNAAQAIPEGRPDANRIRVSLRSDGHAVVVEVSDTGCGIPMAVRDRIFDPFFTTKPVGVGTGLGLSICHRIVTALGGQISLESEVGRGSSFSVRLPIGDGQREAA